MLYGLIYICMTTEIGDVMKFAIISDIHGNYPALKLVIEDALKHGTEKFLFVGDYCISIPWPKEVVETISAMDNAHIIRGNEEGYLNVLDGTDAQFEISRWCKRVLSEEQRKWLNDLPAQIDLECDSVNIHMAHSSEAFIRKAETGNFSTSRTALRYADRYVTHEEFLKDIQHELLKNEELRQILDTLPGGVYIFGHTHIQWHMQVGKHLFINPGSCGLPLDCIEFGAPYTLLTVENGVASIEERRIKYDAHSLIERVKSTAQYEKVPVWSEVIFKEWLTGREKLFFFLKYVEDFARRIGDERRPFAHDTWQAAFEEWKKSS